MSTQSFCPNCGRPFHPIEVHGHIQCCICKVNIEPCCAGGTCDPLSPLFSGEPAECAPPLAGRHPVESTFASSCQV